ncbi:MAG: hypothetical protein AAF664_00545, partial [Planctomycetota bacterium]
MRRWSSSDQKFSVRAQLTKQPQLDDSEISLRRVDDNRIISVPISSLSDSDRIYIRQQALKEQSENNKNNNDTSKNGERSISDDPEAKIETTDQLGASLILGISRRSVSQFANCFALPADVLAAMESANLDAELLDANRRDIVKRASQVRRQVSKLHSQLRSTAAQLQIELDAKSIADVEVSGLKMEKGIESFDKIEVFLRQPNFRVAMLTITEGFRSQRGWLISGLQASIELLPGNTAPPNTSTWELSGARSRWSPITKHQIKFPGQQDPAIRTEKLKTENGEVTAEIFVSRFPGLEYFVQVVDFNNERGSRTKRKTDQE